MISINYCGQDVVARRRLRAGRDQIVLVTRGARSKRIELESIIVSYAISKQSAPERSASSRTSPAGYSSPAFSSLRPTSRAR